MVSSLTGFRIPKFDAQGWIEKGAENDHFGSSDPISFIIRPNQIESRDTA
jgi:hypothetical protein